MTRVRLASCFALALFLIAPVSSSMAQDGSSPSRQARPSGDAAWSHPLQPILDVAGITLHQPIRRDDADEWTEVFTSSAGDLDADGSEDLIEYVYRYSFETDEESLSATAVRGSDGSTMWRRVSGVGYFQPILLAGDLDGKPGDDVIGLTIVTKKTGSVYRWDITYSAVQGSTGTPTWSTTYVNRWGSLVRAGFDQNFVVPEGLIGDVDGDGHADLALTQLTAVGVDGYPLASRSVTRRKLIVHSGRDGTVLKELKIPSAEETMVLAVGSVAGGTAAEIGLASYGNVQGESSEGETQITTVAVYEGTGTASTGTTEEPLWERMYFGYDYPTIGVADLSGDGAMELLVTTHSADESATIQAVSGRTGETLWVEKLSGSVGGRPVVAGDADGDGVPDLHVFTYFWEGDSEGAGVSLLSGANGHALWSVESAPLGGDSYAYTYRAGDTTGDGVEDVFIDQATWDGEYDIESSSTRLIDGADGSMPWSVQDTYFEPLGRDIDGRPGDDLAEIRFDDEFEEVSYRVLNGSDRAQLWDEGFIDLPGNGWVSAYDLRPGAAADVVESGSGGPTIARSGRNGSVLWQRDPLAAA